METTKKSRTDVENLFNQVVIITSNKFDSTNKEHEKILTNLVNYLCNFGCDLAYSVLSKYIYASPGNFFSWADIIGILKDKLKKEYLDSKSAWQKVHKLIGQYGRYNEPELDEVISQTINQLGGWATVCNSIDIEKSFIITYSKILEKTIVEKLEQHAQ